MLPIACNMAAFTPDERRHYDALRARVTAAFAEVLELPNGYRIRLGPEAGVAETAEWMSLEQRCCPFLELTLQLKEGGAVWLELAGRPGAKEMLASEFHRLAAASTTTSQSSPRR